ncbi:hypothetical protein [Methanoregula boonei]|nr:hypothetical protein [Methanoregula boonei]
MQVLITTMEGAARVFAGDYAQATLSVPADEPGNAAWVVTPGGAWCRSLYLCGALTEITEVADVLYCRLADPTGAFDLVAGGRRGVVAGQIRAIPVPSFVAVTGTAQLYRKGGGCVVQVRPEFVETIDKAGRNRWVIATADMAIARLEGLLSAIEGTTGDDRAARVVRHYSLTRENLRDMAAQIEVALAGACTVPDAPPATEEDISAAVMEIIRTESGPRGVSVEDVLTKAGVLGHTQRAVLAAIETLITNDDCYQPQKGYIRPL